MKRYVARQRSFRSFADSTVFILSFAINGNELITKAINVEINEYDYSQNSGRACSMAEEHEEKKKKETVQLVHV